MHAFSAATIPVLWDELPGTSASIVDTALRTFGATGVFRLSLAQELGSDHSYLVDILDNEANDLDDRATLLAMQALQSKESLLRGIKADSPGASYRLLFALKDEYGDSALLAMGVLSDTAQTIDQMLEGSIPVLTPEKLAIQFDFLRRQNYHDVLAEAPNLPAALHAAQWILVAKGFGQVFGADERTIQYSQHDDE